MSNTIVQNKWTKETGLQERWRKNRKKKEEKEKQNW
jgi:hypothetical protein